MRLSIIIIFQFIYCVNLNAQDIFRVNVDTISSRDLLLVLSARLLRCLGFAGNNHQTKDSGTTADDGLSTRKKAVVGVDAT